jgi:hypothetical protein
MRSRRSGAAAAVLLVVLLTACSNPLGRQYEYEEQLYLSVDGSATVVVDASIPAFVALRGAAFDPSFQASVNREQVRAWFEQAGCQDVRVGRPWVRHGRRFIQVRLAARDIRELASCGALAWSRYQFERGDNEIHFVQEVGAAANGEAGPVNWNGQELVGFKLHAPSRIFYHNVRRLEDGEPGDADRGNILTWEQTLANRRAGQPITMEVRMGAESILLHTLTLFGSAFAAAVAVLALIIWITIRRAKRSKLAASSRP